MRALIIGSGGREHALAWKLRESELADQVICAPGNAGIAQDVTCVSVDLSRSEQIVELARDTQADVVVIGPEAPLVAGVVDDLEFAGITAIGPTRAAARLEGSKIFAKQFMQRHGIPTARFRVASELDEALQALTEFTPPVVIKADGLAAGKGVVVAPTLDVARQALDDFMHLEILGEAGTRVVIEECLKGEEVSILVLTDGAGILPFPPAQDHKRALDKDQGPNTGGMGAYSDDSLLSAAARQAISDRIVTPTLAGMAEDGAVYRGVIYCGLMLTAQGPKVLEYNVRLGDPETQPLMMRLRSDLLQLFLAWRERQLAAIEARWTPNPAVCVVLASGGYPGKYETGKPISGIDAAEAIGGIKVFHSGTRLEDDRLVTAGGRVLGVTAVGEDLPSAIERAYLAEGKIQFEGMHFRRDIGAAGKRGSPAKAPKSNSAPAENASPPVS
jgi:phosphoribosylamine--glycine ligase